MPQLHNSIAAGYKIIHDANLQNLTEIIGCRLSNANKVLQTNLALATIIKPQILVGRQQAINTLRIKTCEHWEYHFARIAHIESDILSFFEESGKDKDSLENDAIAQLSFQDELFRPLNHIPWMVFLIALFKVWVVPAMTLMTPILAWIVPYILLRFVYAFPINQQEYIRVLQNMWVGNMGIPDLNMSEPDMLTPRSIVQFILFGFSFAQSMIQPIQNAMHLNKADSVIVGIGKKLVEIRDIIRSMKSDIGDLDLKLTNLLEEVDSQDYRRGFLLVKEQPARLQMALRDLAEVEVIWRLSLMNNLKSVIFKPNIFALSEMVDISLTNGVSSTLSLSSATEQHAIITGPNGGGKSSFLRATLQSVVLGHTYGVAPATQAIMPRFRWIASGLQLRDTPGLYSMFETEVKFAADCIQSSRSPGPGLILFDELFHSTNPPDGARSASVFLKQLWAPESNAYSVVSTHVFPLVENKPDNVQAICCPATNNEDGTVSYSYKAEPGICRVSSVHMVWAKYGLRRGRESKVNLSTRRRNTPNAD
jgi:hypothetical protein